MIEFAEDDAPDRLPVGVDVILPSDRADWLKARKTGIGSSDAPALLGQGYKSLLELWLEKTGRMEGTPTNTRLEVGHALEPTVAAMASRKLGLELVDPGDFTIFKRVASGTPLLATVDRFLLDDFGKYGSPVELKTASYFDRPRWDREPPLYPQLQVQWQLAVLGQNHGHVAALFGLGEDEGVWPVERHNQVIELLLDAAERFWKCIRTDTPPEADGSKGAARALQMIYPKDTGRVILLPATYAEKLERRANLEAQRDAIEDELGRINNGFREALKESSWGLIEGTEKAVSWRFQKSELPAQPARTITSRVLRVQRRPKGLEPTPPEPEEVLP